MFKWKKLGKIFDPRDRKSAGWMQEFAQSPSVVIFDNFVRVYFCTRPAPTQDGQYLSYLSYIDLDRRNLLNIVNICQKPILSLGGYGALDEFGTNPISVIRDRDTVRVYYAGWTRCESVPFNGAIGMAISSDNGNSFERLGPGPVLSYCPDEPFLLGSPRIRKFHGTWYLWYVAGREWLKLDGKAEPVYKIRMASSDDGIAWTKLGKDLIENKLGEHECQACADVLLHQGRYHMFYSYRSTQNYKIKEGGYRIGYAFSTDMVNWQRQDELAGMDVSAEGWDSEMVNYPHVFMLDGESYMLYQGNEMGRSGFGLAKLDSNQDWSSP
jgi:predicted GH43/DUF377 family glycosyl hydrolase